MKKIPKIAILGCGHMGQAMAHGLLQAGFRHLWLTNHHEQRFVEFFKAHTACCGKKSFTLSTNNQKAVQKSDYILICVRPFQIKDVLNDLKSIFKKSQILISVAAGTSISALQKWSGHKKIVRVMPNLPAQIQLGMSVWKAVHLMKNEKITVRSILSAFGEEIEVKNEDFIDAATAISGSGPAYVFAFLEALEKSAIQFGFKPPQAQTLALMTLHGSTVYASQQTDDFGVLKEKVKTKGGVTEAAFTILDKKGWQKILQEGVKNAYKRVKQISARIK